MSKIGRKPIDITGLTVELKGKDLHFKGPNGQGVYTLPKELTASIDNNQVTLVPEATEKRNRDLNRVWGLHRALLTNILGGAKKDFEKKVEIVGLGYKAVKAGDGLTFALGYSHKLDFPLPKEVTVEIDKTGQKLTFSSADKTLLGQVCSNVCALRAPEPYKGTGIKLATQQLLRKVGKKAK